MKYWDQYFGAIIIDEYAPAFLFLFFFLKRTCIGEYSFAVHVAHDQEKKKKKQRTQKEKKFLEIDLCPPTQIY